MSTPAMQDAISDLLESEAIEKYYIGKAEKPAITINRGVFTAPDAKRNEHFTVWFGSGIDHFNYRKLKDAQAKAEQILQSAKKPIEVRAVDKNGRTRHLSFSSINSNRKGDYQMSEIEPCLEDIETFCSKKRHQVLILLRTSQEPKGCMITGVPDSCNSESGCSKGALCLLKANQITTGRKHR